jgi:hypothetical protein
MIVNNEFEMIWKEAVAAWFEVLLWHLPGGTDKNTKKRVRIVNISADIRTGHLPNTSHEHLTQLAWYVSY